MTQSFKLSLHPREYAGIAAVAKRFKVTIEDAAKALASIELAQQLSGEKARGSTKDMLDTYRKAHDSWGILLSKKQRQQIARDWEKQKL